MPLSDYALDVLDVLQKRRDPEGRTIQVIASTEMLDAIGSSRRSGKNLGSVRSLLDAVCIQSDLPWIGRLIQFQNPAEDFSGHWALWKPFKRYLVEVAPRERRWSDEDFDTLRNGIAAFDSGPEAWWQRHAESAELDKLLRKALLVVLRQALPEAAPYDDMKPH